ncbi:MAG: gene transfer agent family protein [Brucellaceae bacterium]|nr:gene transfer agent family protein [Brucellaceae bacterium]
MANIRRGEIAACFDGAEYTLCLTLGALAELEQAFGAGDLTQLVERFSSGRLSATDLVTIIAAGLRGAGHEVTRADVERMRSDDGVAGFADAASRLLEAAFGAASTGEGATANPPTP